ncbi:MAG: hypothetical protein AB8B92_07545 [Gammaproteobacteria bacterium]
MSTPEFDKFDLEGLSLEDIEPAKPVKAERPKDQFIDDLEEHIVISEPIDEVIEPELVKIADSAESDDGQMVCPKCELEQIKAEQCSGCGVYVEKAKAQIGQSKIEITSVKF